MAITRYSLHYNQPLPVIVEVAGVLVVNLLSPGQVSRVTGGLRYWSGNTLILGKTLERLGAPLAIKIKGGSLTF